MWAVTGSLATARAGHTATLLSNGQVLAVGGSYRNGHRVATAELYDPESGSWTATNSLRPGRSGQTATLLRNGNVLVSGGDSRDGILSSAELYKSAPKALDPE